MTLVGGHMTLVVGHVTLVGGDVTLVGGHVTLLGDHVISPHSSQGKREGVTRVRNTWRTRHCITTATASGDER